MVSTFSKPISMGVIEFGHRPIGDRDIACDRLQTRFQSLSLGS